MKSRRLTIALQATNGRPGFQLRSQVPLRPFAPELGGVRRLHFGCRTRPFSPLAADSDLMHLIRQLPGMLLCSLLLAACSAPASGPTPQSALWSSDEAQIRAATRASAEAWNRGDLKGHLSIYTDTVTFMTRSGPRPGVAAIEEAFTKTYFHEGRPKQQLRFEQVVVRPLGRDAALETGRFVLSGGGAPEQSGWFSLVWVRTPQGWRVVHDHSS